MEYKKQEQRGVILGIVANTIMGIAGVVIYRITKIDALFLDAYFTLLAVFSGVVAVIISKQSKKTSKAFPHGRFMLEPLYAILKSILTLFLLGYTLSNGTAKVLEYFRYGTGEMIEVGPAIPYEIAMVVLGFCLYGFYRRQNKKTNDTSIILAAEAKNTLIDTLMSGAIGVGVLFLSIIPVGSQFEFLLYTGDFWITLFLVLFTIREPITVCKDAFIELTNGVVTDEEVKSSIEEVVEKNLPEDMEIRNCHIHKTGMSFRILIEVDSKKEMINTTELYEKSKTIKKELASEYENVKVNFLFP